MINFRGCLLLGGNSRSLHSAVVFFENSPVNRVWRQAEVSNLRRCLPISYTNDFVFAISLRATFHPQQKSKTTFLRLCLLFNFSWVYNYPQKLALRTCYIVFSHSGWQIISPAILAGFDTFLGVGNQWFWVGKRQPYDTTSWFLVGGTLMKFHTGGTMVPNYLMNAVGWVDYAWLYRWFSVCFPRVDSRLNIFFASVVSWCTANASYRYLMGKIESFHQHSKFMISFSYLELCHTCHKFSIFMVANKNF